MFGRPRSNKATSVAQVGPQPPSEAVIALQKQIAKKTRSPLGRLVIQGGWVIPAVAVGLFTVSAVVFGAERTGELLLGLTSPRIPHLMWWQSALAWCMSVIGWLAVPTVVGLVVGYIVTARLSRYRSKTYEEIAGEGDLENE